MYDKIVEKFIKSEDMVKYLKEQELNEIDIMSIVTGSPVSLNDKINAILDLKEIATNNNNQTLTKYVTEALSIYDIFKSFIDTDGVYSVISHYYNYERNDIDKSFEGLFLSFDLVKSYISEIDDYVDEDDYYWYEINKWVIEDGNLQPKVDMVMVHNEIYYFTLSHFHCRIDFDASELRLPVPFKAGDILEVDLFPFGPKIPILAISIGDNKDCCSFIGMSRDEDKLWKIAAVKHGFVGPDIYPKTAPLFTIRKYNGNLPDDDRFCMTELSKYLKDHNEQSQDISDFLLCRGRDMTDELLTKWINDNFKFK